MQISTASFTTASTAPPQVQSTVLTIKTAHLADQPIPHFALEWLGQLRQELQVRHLWEAMCASSHSARAPLHQSAHPNTYHTLAGKHQFGAEHYLLVCFNQLL